MRRRLYGGRFVGASLLRAAFLAVGFDMHNRIRSIFDSSFATPYDMLSIGRLVVADGFRGRGDKGFDCWTRCFGRHLCGSAVEAEVEVEIETEACLGSPRQAGRHKAH